MTEPESLLEDVKRERAKYGTPLTNAEMGELLNAVAWTHRDEGWALAYKDTGALTQQPRTWQPISRDLLIHVPSGSMYDVLRDVAGEGEPQWLYLGPADLPSVDPVEPEGAIEGPPSSVRHQIEVALVRIATAEVALSEAHEALMEALRK